MQSFKLIKSPNQEIEDPIDPPHIPTAVMPGQNFFNELFQDAVGNTNKKMALALSFLLILVQRTQLSIAIHSQR